MKENLVPSDDGKRSGRVGVSLSTVILAITVTLLVIVVIGGGFMYFNLSQRVRHMEAELMAADSEEVRDKRQVSRGSCFVCPTGPPGSPGRKGKSGRRGKSGKPGHIGPKGHNGVCHCPKISKPKQRVRTGKHKVTEPYVTTPIVYETTTKADGYGSSTTGGYKTTDSDHNKVKKPEYKPTEGYKTTEGDGYGTSTTEGYTTTEGYITTASSHKRGVKPKIRTRKPVTEGYKTEGYETTTESYTTTEEYDTTTTVDPRHIIGNKGYGGDSGPRGRSKGRKG